MSREGMLVRPITCSQLHLYPSVRFSSIARHNIMCRAVDPRERLPVTSEITPVFDVRQGAREDGVTILA